MSPPLAPLSHVELVTIGDELLLGFTIDTNAAHLARELAAIGIVLERRTTVGDNPAAIADAVNDALERAGAVITTGGLGPTSDDLTKPAIGALFGRQMKLDEEHLEWMERRWKARFDTPLPAANRQQAMVPEGAQKLANNHGSAPGIWLEDDRGRWVAMLPGVPREMRGMLADTLLPRLRARVLGDTVVRSLTLRTTGVGESLLADRIDGMPGPELGASLAYLPSAPGVDLRLTVQDSASRAPATLALAGARLRELLGVAIYGEDDAELAAVVLDLCRARGFTIGVAESCTGGLLGARLTAIPGSSDVVRGGIIAYHDDIKRSLLTVDSALIANHGAVSEPVVRAMATAARAATASTIGLAITGVAGPGGGTPDKPVGTVWIAADVEGTVHARVLKLWGDREEIRYRAAQALLDLTRRLLIGG